MKGRILESELDLPIIKLLTGPIRGDQQMGSKIAEGEMNTLIFFWDHIEPQPNDPDDKVLLRVAHVWSIPTATNIVPDDYLL